MVPVRCGRKAVWGVLGLHVLAAGAALALPPGACLAALAGIGLSAAAFLREARRPVFLQCHNGVVSGRLSEEGAGEISCPIRVTPLLGRSLLLLEFVGPRGRRYRTIGRGDLADEDFRTLLANARWPVRSPQGRIA